MQKVFLSAVLLAIFLFGSAAYADTKYKYINGNVIKWYKQDVALCLDEEVYQLPGIERIAIEAAKMWSSVPGGPKPRVDLTHKHCDIFVGYSTLPEKWDTRPLAINVMSSHVYGDMVKSEITINKYYHGKFGDASLDRSVYDLYSVFAHELGHALGLEGEPNDKKSVMYESFSSGTVLKRDLRPADIRSLTKLYKNDFN